MAEVDNLDWGVVSSLLEKIKLQPLSPEEVSIVSDYYRKRLSKIAEERKRLLEIAEERPLTEDEIQTLLLYCLGNVPPKTNIE